MSVQIALAGDVMIGRLVNEFLNAQPAEKIWGDFLEEFHKTDLNLINLEAALTRSEKKEPKVFNFKADPEKVQTLKAARIDVVNLANNHVLDFSEEGLIETLKTLDSAHILHVGAGLNSEEVKKPVTVEKKGIKIGIIGCTDNEPGWNATENNPGIFYVRVGDLDPLLKVIEPLRKKVDIIILTMHWGPNMRERPTKAFQQFARQLIEGGVDIFHGHSAHIFQGFEEYKNGLILYDTGDFIDDYYVDPMLRNDLSFLFVVEVTKKGYASLKLIPSKIENFSVHKAKGETALWIQKRMELLAREFKTITAVPERRP